MNKLSDTQAAGLDGVSWDHRVIWRKGLQQ